MFSNYTIQCQPRVGSILRPGSSHGLFLMSSRRVFPFHRFHSFPLSTNAVVMLIKDLNVHYCKAASSQLGTISRSVSLHADRELSEEDERPHWEPGSSHTQHNTSRTRVSVAGLTLQHSHFLCITMFSLFPDLTEETRRGLACFTVLWISSSVLIPLFMYRNNVAFSELLNPETWIPFTP